jgi:hypothetical protein
MDDGGYAAAFFPSPNASANRLYDFLRAWWSYTAVMIINSSGLPAVIIGCNFAMMVAGLPTNSRERLRATEARSASL